jgi:pyrroloquinoline quinone (PQQ) biosynthesis protein C
VIVANKEVVCYNASVTPDNTKVNTKTNDILRYGRKRTMNNKEIRNAAGGHGLKLWEVAEAIGMNESAFSRKLRKELPQEEKQRILEAIDRLAQEKQGVA